MPCLGHMLHNAVCKGLDTDEIKGLLAHCRRIVALFHSSQPYRTKLKKVLKDLKMEDKQLVNDVVTRWGSKFKMLQRIQEQMKATNQIFIDDRKYRDLTINGQQAGLIDTLIKTLDGFNSLTDRLSGEKEVTVTSVIPFLRFICALCEHEVGEEEVSSKVKDVIKDYFSTRLQDADLLMFLRVAEVLDPRYQQLSSDDDCPATIWLSLPSLEEVKQYILTNAPAIILSRTATVDDAIQTTGPSKKKSKMSLADLLVSKVRTDGQTSSTQDPDFSAEEDCRQKLQREFDFFVRLTAASDEDVLQWWKLHRVELPLLSKYARYVLSSCASSVPSERLFSLSGNIISKKRNALKPYLVEQLVFLAMNKDMI